ncbi:MAG: glycoside hydrolase family 25 protein [Clostridium sp.]|nr:glycoside hydrolase family 25 protein [Clostridium sp.]MCM1399725.1 glycoside hydrolase family 25 protein [Clostridium sp.]MCM1460440.1 glycoside hydrolase family 25 protein [Bacteroides sp.]
MRIDIRKVLLVVAAVAILIAIGIVIGININVKRDQPQPVFVYEDDWLLSQGQEGQMIYENYWKFIDASYIIVGTPPDCQFYKIVTEIPRNDFVNENFYIDADDEMYYHDNEGNRQSYIVIDVSEFQPEVDWEQVKSTGVKGVMIRVGYRGYGSGALVEDSMFQTYVESALDAGLKAGVYFYTQGISYEEGVEEARFVLNAIRTYNITYPIAIDTEAIYADDARTNDLDITSRTDVVVGFCETVKEAGYTPMVYTNRNWLVQCLDLTRLGDYKIWYAHYTNQPDLPYQYTGWQYTDSGHVNGVSGNVDMNVWFE